MANVLLQCGHWVLVRIVHRRKVITTMSKQRDRNQPESKTGRDRTHDSRGGTPTQHEWKRLCEAAIQFRDLAPWNWMYEHQVFSLVNPEDGEVGYCSVLGTGGDLHALSVYRGEEGLLSFERIQQLGQDGKLDGPGSLTDPDVFLSQKSLMVSFESSRDVDKRDRDVFQSLGLRFRGKQAWPVLRSYEPGCVPWFLTAKECRFLTVALEQAIVVAERLAENPNLLEEQPGCILTRTANDGGQGGEAREWVDDWPAWPYLDEEMDDEFANLPVQVDEMRLKRAMRAGKSSGAWEVDITYAPFSVQEEERPYFPRLMLCVHNESSMVLTAYPAERRAEPAEFVDQFIRTMEQHKLYPEQIVVRRPEVGQMLIFVAHVLGADVLVSDVLPGVELTREEMQRFMG